MTMRDAFFNRLFKYAKNNNDIILLTSDFSAPSFDRYRTELPGQFINTGISEQNTMLVAAGLACSGKKVFVTSIAPFITMRCFEQTRLYAADMNQHIIIAAVGAGFSYNTAGPTHHSVEDIALMRTLPHMRTIIPSCNRQVEAAVDWCVENAGPAYVRMDRMVLDELCDGNFNIDNDGFRIVRTSDDVTIVASGYMVHTALRTENAGVIDLYSLPAGKENLLNELKKVKRIITLDEHVYSGGIGAYVCELLSDCGCYIPVKRLALDVSSGFYNRYGTRDDIHEACGMGINKINDLVRSF